MRKVFVSTTLLLVMACAFLLGARGNAQSVNGNSTPAEGAIPVDRTVADSPGTVAGQEGSDGAKGLEAAPAQPSAYRLKWYSMNAGGATRVTSPGYGMGLSVGQSAAGSASSPSYGVGVGFWYGAGGAACPITRTGDVNISGSITSADIIRLVNYVFKGATPPLPCEAAGDVNCGGTVTSSDVIYLVNHVFKGGPLPCDGCTSPLAAAC
jgi:hypothetical protein